MSNMNLSYKLRNRVELTINGNRMSCRAHICKENNAQLVDTFILDTGAIISTISKGIYEENKIFPNVLGANV